jgi:hypothetical protein
VEFIEALATCVRPQPRRGSAWARAVHGRGSGGTGGFRKLRWADRRRRKGKRGGLRAVYYYLSADGQIRLMTLYDKDEMADLSAAEKRALKAALEAELTRRAARRQLRRK